jgi:F0F1-type ATP synthase alpha subunit
MVEIKPDEISAILRQQLSNANTEASLEEVGTVLQVGDGIARVYGLTGVRQGELVSFENGVKAIALNLEEDNVGVVLMGDSAGIKEGATVRRTGQIASIKVGEGNTTLLNNLAYEYISDTHKETISLKQNISEISVKSLTPNVCSVDSYYSIFGIRSGKCRLQLTTNDYFWLEGANQVVEVQIEGTVSKKKNSKKK